MISQKIINKLNKSKIYCYSCAENNVLHPLEDLHDHYEICEQHSYHRGNFYTVRYHDNRWWKSRGVLKQTKIESKIITLEEDQQNVFNSRYNFINEEELPSDVQILECENGLFYLCELFDQKWITLSINEYNLYKINLSRHCKSCGKKFNIINIQRIDESICCSKSCYQKYENKRREDLPPLELHDSFLESLNTNQFYCLYCVKSGDKTILDKISEDTFQPCELHRGANFMMLGHINGLWNTIHGVNKNGQKHPVKTVEDEQKEILHNEWWSAVKVEELHQKSFRLKTIEKQRKKRRNKIYWLGSLLGEMYVSKNTNKFQKQMVQIMGKCSNYECNNIVEYDFSLKPAFCGTCINEYGNYSHTCKACGRLFLSNGTVMKYCKLCKKEFSDGINGDVTLVNTEVIMDMNERPITFHVYKSEHFTFNYQECPTCGRKRRVNKIIPKHKISLCDASCRSVYNMGPGFCTNTNCGEYSITRDSTGLCIKCRTEISSSIWSIKWCEECQEVALHNGNSCIQCNPESGGGMIPNFVTKHNVKMFLLDGQYVPVESIIQMIESNQIQPPKHWNKRYDHWCYDTMDVLSGDSVLYSGRNFVIRDSVECVLNHSTGKYEHWEMFKRKMQERMKDIQLQDSIIHELVEKREFKFEPIVKVNDGMWNREQTDRYLFEQGYGWICYVKLLDGKPWIVGKTGTSAVSSSPVDFDFRLHDENDPDNPNYNGPGRRLALELYPNMLYSDFDKILILGFDDEVSTLEMEHKIAKEYELFES